MNDIKPVNTNDEWIGITEYSSENPENKSSEDDNLSDVSFDDNDFFNQNGLQEGGTDNDNNKSEVEPVGVPESQEEEVEPVEVPEAQEEEAVSEVSAPEEEKSESSELTKYQNHKKKQKVPSTRRSSVRSISTRRRKIRITRINRRIITQKKKV